MNAFVSQKHTEESSLFTFRVTKDFELPSRIARCTQEQFELVLKIANQILAYKESLCNEEFSQSMINEITKEHEQKIKDLEKEYQRDTSRHQQESTARINRLESSLIEQEKHFKKEIAELEVALHRASSTQDLIKKQYLDEADRRIQQHKEDSELRITEVKESDMRHIEYLQKENTRMRDEIKGLIDEKTMRQVQLSNSSQRGKEGEVAFETLALEKKGWHLLYTGNKGHSGDYCFRIYDVNIRFEVKNYTHTIPTKEVDKLRRDMREHPETDIGVFISLNTNINSVKDVCIEWTNTNQLILYVPLFLQKDIDLMFHFLDLVFQTVKPYRAIISDATKNDQYPILKERIDRTILYAQNGLLRITQSINQFALDMRAVQDRLDDMVSHTKANLAAQQAEINSIIAILTGKEKDIEIDDDPPKNLPVVHDDKKKNKRKKVSS